MTCSQMNGKLLPPWLMEGVLMAWYKWRRNLFGFLASKSGQENPFFETEINLKAKTLSDHVRYNSNRWNKLWSISGGKNSSDIPIKSSEIFENGTFNEGPDIPEAIIKHYMVKINTTHSMVTGGHGNGGVSSQFWLGLSIIQAVSYTHLTLPTTPYV